MYLLNNKWLYYIKKSDSFDKLTIKNDLFIFIFIVSFIIILTIV